MFFYLSCTISINYDYILLIFRNLKNAERYYYRLKLKKIITALGAYFILIYEDDIIILDSDSHILKMCGKELIKNNKEI